MITSVVLGVLVGLVMGLTGAGGGVLAIPLLVSTLHLSIAEAAPLSLLAIGTAAALGSVSGLRAGLVRYRAALLMAVSGILAAPAGVLLGTVGANTWLSLAFSGVLLIVAYRTWRQARAGAPPPDAGTPPCLREEASGRFIWTAACARMLAGAGALAGLLSGLLGIGGGFVMVPVLQRYTDLPMRAVTATSLAVIFLISATGTLASFAAGRLDLAIGLPFMAGAMLGMMMGRAAAAKCSERALKLTFALLCAVTAFIFAAQTLFNAPGAAALH